MIRKLRKVKQIFGAEFVNKYSTEKTYYLIRSITVDIKVRALTLFLTPELS